MDTMMYNSMESLRCIAQWTLYSLRLNRVFTVYSSMDTLWCTTQWSLYWCIAQRTLYSLRLNRVFRVYSLIATLLCLSQCLLHWVFSIVISQAKVAWNQLSKSVRWAHSKSPSLKCLFTFFRCTVVSWLSEKQVKGMQIIHLLRNETIAMKIDVINQESQMNFCESNLYSVMYV